MAKPGQEYVHPSTDAESERLEKQARLYGGAGFLDPFLADNPASILEVGCGTGYFVRHAAEQVPGARVVGLDMDESRIAFARSRSDAPNAKFQPGDLTSLPFADDSFDLVFCRFVLVHYSDPLQAIAEMSRVTRPGGRVAAYEMIHDAIWFSPPKPAFTRLLKRTIDVLREQGAEPDQGLHLPTAMKRAGLEEVQVQVIPNYAMSPDPLYESHRENWQATVTGLSETLGPKYEEGLAEQAQKDLATRSDHDFLVEITVLSHGRKAG
jgi:ubiquinone/menaquinone biosynthesis C-methylase UbiE